METMQTSLEHVERWAKYWPEVSAGGQLDDGILWAGFALCIHPGEVAFALNPLPESVKAYIIKAWIKNPESLLADDGKLGLAPELAEWCRSASSGLD
jgi:hypothetical protein